MASNNETIADIVREMVEFGNHCAAFGGAYSPERWDNLCKRLNLAHKRALAAKDDERLTIVANYETVIAAKDAEIARLRDKIKVAEDALKNSPCGVIYQLGISDDDGNFYDGVVIKFDEAEVLKMPRVRQGDKFRVLPLNALAAI